MKRKNTSPETPAAKKDTKPPVKKDNSPGRYSIVENSLEDKVKEAVSNFAKVVTETITEHLQAERNK